ncbi:MAG: VWA domain-containing protein [Candidatus Methanomethylophilaceae archaeon]|nr:VWA domain-containing protein [Candidatus Methanomethylophilaceae archaeon]
MKEKKITEMVFVIDRSGSMSGFESDTIGGFNSTIDKQKKEDGDAVVSTVLFSDRVQILHDRIGLKEIGRMTEDEYFVGGCTALLDAVGGTIERIKHEQAKDKDNVPDATLFVIITDGLENASREFSYKKVKEMIETQKKAGWDFLFLGANIDVAAEADRIGIDSCNTVEYRNDSEGIKAMYDCVSRRMSVARTVGNFETDETS